MASSSSAPADAPYDGKPIRVLFVCLGNICRSPMAHAVFEHMISSSDKNSSDASSSSSSSSSTSKKGGTVTFQVDSAGTGAYHAGDSPDPRTLRTLERHGITGFTHPARKVRVRDFTHDFDYVLAMDADNLYDLERVRASAGSKNGGGDGGKLATLAMFGDYGGSSSGGSGRGGGGGKRGGGGGEDIVDPYYGGGEGFETAYGQCVRFSKGFLNEVVGDGWEGMVGKL